MKTFNELERIQRVWDIVQIKNLMARHYYLHLYGKRIESLRTNWVSTPDNMSSASFGSNRGYVVGMDAIRKNYAKCGNTPVIGCFNQVHLTTPIIHVADDGQSAQGIWYSPCCTTEYQLGTLTARWVYKKIGADFLLEGNQWKIWHLFEGSDLVLEPKADIAEIPVDDPMEEYAFSKWDMTIPCKAYTSRYNYMPYPPVPQPYETFSSPSVISNGPGSIGTTEKQ